MRLSKLPKKRLLTSLIGGLAAAGAIAVAAHNGGGSPANRELAWLSHLAKTGNTGAQLQLGLVYREGRYGVKPDARTSLRWLSAAGRGGNAYAADVVANAFAAGQGAPRNAQLARHWWQLAASGGNADAQTHLGEALLAEGKRDRAVDWLRDAADRGDARAHNDLAALYRQQAVTDADLHRGENRIAALGERLDSDGWKAIFATWRTVAASSPLEQTAGALVSRAQQGDPVAEYQLALRYRDGAWSVTRDPQQAMTWLQRSAAAGNPVAAQTLAETGHHSNTAGPTATSPPDGSRT
ncbi:MAG: tetratricopeptide repeat protein [Thiogranum sp.]|jgi:hypothetical protein